MYRPHVNETGLFGFSADEVVGKAIIVSDSGCTVEDCDGNYVFFDWGEFSYFIPDNANDAFMEKFHQDWEEATTSGDEFFELF